MSQTFQQGRVYTFFPTSITQIWKHSWFYLLSTSRAKFKDSRVVSYSIKEIPSIFSLNNTFFPLHCSFQL